MKLKYIIGCLLLAFVSTVADAQEFLMIQEEPDLRTIMQLGSNQAQAIFIATTSDIAITTSNKSVDKVAEPKKNGKGEYEYIVTLNLSGGHKDRHFSVEKRGTSFRATTKKKVVFAPNECRYFRVVEPKMKIMLSAKETKTHLVRGEACVEITSPRNDLIVDAPKELKAQVKTSQTAGDAYVTQIILKTAVLEQLKSNYAKSDPDYWSSITTVRVKFSNSNELEVPCGDLTQREKHKYVVLALGSGTGADEKPTQYVFIDVQPTDADVLFDGLKVPVTNGRATIFTSRGQHTYHVTREHYHSTTDTVMVEDSPVEHSTTLEPAFGSLNIVGTPSRNLPVFIDENPVGTAPLKIDTVDSGIHSVSLRNEKFNYSYSILIEDATTTTLHVRRAKLFEWNTFATVNAAIGVPLQWSVGVKAGMVKMFGWYVSFMTNGYFKGIKNPLTQNELYQMSGHRRACRISAMAGLAVRPIKLLSIHAGIGYGYVGMQYEAIPWTQSAKTAGQYEWMSHPNTISGMDVALGAGIHVKRFFTTFEVATTHFKTLEFRIGAGFCLSTPIGTKRSGIRN